MAFCTKCGNELKDGDLFCGKCGWKVGEQITVVTSQPVKPTNIVIKKRVVKKVALKEDPIKYFGLGIKKYFSFKGTTNRTEFFWYIGYQLFILIGILLANLIDKLILKSGTIVEDILKYVLQVYVMFFCIPNLSILIRRLHDVNKRGWWLLVPIYGIILCFGKSKEYTKKPKKIEVILGKILVVLFTAYLLNGYIRSDFGIGIPYIKSIQYFIWRIQFWIKYHK